MADWGWKGEGRARLPIPQYFPLAIDFDEYIRLVEWTGKAMQADKRGAIPADVAPTLERLNINPDQWSNSVKHFESRFFYTVGEFSRMLNNAINSGRRWVKGKRGAQLLYRTALSDS